jgi:hypothetical protein
MNNFVEKLDTRLDSIVELVFAAVCIAALYCGGTGFMALTALTV